MTVFSFSLFPFSFCLFETSKQLLAHRQSFFFQFHELGGLAILHKRILAKSGYRSERNFQFVFLKPSTALCARDLLRTYSLNMAICPFSPRNMADLEIFFRPPNKNPFVEVAGPLFCLVRNFARNKKLLNAEQPAGFFIQFLSHRKFGNYFHKSAKLLEFTLR